MGFITNMFGRIQHVFTPNRGGPAAYFPPSHYGNWHAQPAFSAVPLVPQMHFNAPLCHPVVWPAPLVNLGPSAYPAEWLFANPVIFGATPAIQGIRIMQSAQQATLHTPRNVPGAGQIPYETQDRRSSNTNTVCHPIQESVVDTVSHPIRESVVSTVSHPIRESVVSTVNHAIQESFEIDEEGAVVHRHDIIDTASDSEEVGVINAARNFIPTNAAMLRPVINLGPRGLTRHQVVEQDTVINSTVSDADSVVARTSSLCI